jgi:hypothetical protein
MRIHTPRLRLQNKDAIIERSLQILHKVADAVASPHQQASDQIDPR